MRDRLSAVEWPMEYDLIKICNYISGNLQV